MTIPFSLCNGVTTSLPLAVIVMITITDHVSEGSTITHILGQVVQITAGMHAVHMIAQTTPFLLKQIHA